LSTITTGGASLSLCFSLSLLLSLALSLEGNRASLPTRFPVDLTLLMAEEKGMVVDQEGYDASMAEQKVFSSSLLLPSLELSDTQVYEP